MNSIKATIRRVANRFGVEITRIPKTKSSSMTQEYGTVSPAATYSPWNKDNSFQAMFINQLKMLSIGFGTRWFLAELWFTTITVSMVATGLLNT